MEKILQKQEALKRMEILQLHKNAIKEFSEEGKINKSHNGGLYWIDSDLQKIVDNFEKNTGFIVYHIIENYSDIGIIYSFLYVNKSKNEWEIDERDCKDKQILVYCYNKNNQDLSEYGYIAIKPFIGGLLRLA